MFPPSLLLPNSHYLPTYLILCSFSLFQITQANQINEKNKRNKFLKNHKNTKIKTKENRQKTIKTKKSQNKTKQKPAKILLSSFCVSQLFLGMKLILESN